MAWACTPQPPFCNAPTCLHPRLCAAMGTTLPCRPAPFPLQHVHFTQTPPDSLNTLPPFLCSYVYDSPCRWAFFRLPLHALLPPPHSATCLRAQHPLCSYVYDSPMPLGRMVRQVADKAQVGARNTRLLSVFSVFILRCEDTQRMPRWPTRRR